MNKNDLIAAVADATEFSKKDTEVIINATLDAITTALRDCERVQLVGFGSFEIRNRAARTGRNPRTGEIVKISATRVPTFKPGKTLKEALSE